MCEDAMHVQRCWLREDVDGGRGVLLVRVHVLAIPSRLKSGERFQGSEACLWCEQSVGYTATDDLRMNEH